MKYWGYLTAKLAVAAALLLGLRRLIALSFPRPEPMHFGRYVLNPRPDPFATDLNYTFVMMLFGLVAVGVVWAVIWDQRYRCRTCLRRLRMPIQTGSWTYMLQVGRPQTEYICPYGHGTLKVEELQITGHQGPDWEPHEDMWKELIALEDSKK
jgi:hypothetical protein